MSHNQHNHKRILLEPFLRIPQVQCVREVAYPLLHYVEHPSRKALIRVHTFNLFIYFYIREKFAITDIRPCELHEI